VSAADFARASFVDAITNKPDEQRREQIHQMFLDLLDACEQSPLSDNIAAALAAFIAPLDDVRGHLERAFMTLLIRELEQGDAQDVETASRLRGRYP
jgi:hypothetical protein